MSVEFEDHFINAVDQWRYMSAWSSFVKLAGVELSKTCNWWFSSTDFALHQMTKKPPSCFGFDQAYSSHWFGLAVTFPFMVCTRKVHRKRLRNLKCRVLCSVLTSFGFLWDAHFAVVFFAKWPTECVLGKSWITFSAENLGLFWNVF